MNSAARLLVNIDVDDLAAAERFYTAAWPVTAMRRFGSVVELTGLPAPLYLIERPPGTHQTAYGPESRRYDRHWTPVHLDLAVDDFDAAVARVLTAGATAQGPARDVAYGRIATFADPFGHGFCLIAFNAAGYDAIAD